MAIHALHPIIKQFQLACNKDETTTLTFKYLLEKYEGTTNKKVSEEQRILLHTECALIQLEIQHQTSTINLAELDLLKALLIEVRIPSFLQSTPSKWKNTTGVDVIQSLSRLNAATLAVSTEEQMNLVKKEALLKRIHYLQNAHTFEVIKKSVTPQFIFNKTAFVESLLAFAREFDNDIEKTKMALSDRLKHLTPEELAKWRKQIKKMIPTINAFYGVRYVSSKVDNNIRNLTADAYEDSVKTFEKLKQNHFNHYSSAKKDITLASKQINLLLMSVYEVLEEESMALNTGIHKVPREVGEAQNWPENGGQLLSIPISSADRKLMTRAITAYYTPKSELSLQVRAEAVDQHFGKMTQSLGFFFNPHRFCDSMFQLSPKHIENLFKDGLSNTEVAILYKKLKSQDVQDLMLILKLMHEGESNAALCAWLSIDKSYLNHKDFEELTGKLYHTMNMLMRTAHEHINVDDAYVKPSRTVAQLCTVKNAVCIKQLFTRYLGVEMPKPTLMQRCYNWMYPSDIVYVAREDVIQEKDNEDLDVSVTEGSDEGFDALGRVDSMELLVDNYPT